jgi:hypothetical protein
VPRPPTPMYGIYNKSSIRFFIRFSQCLLLGLAFACNFGGMTTPIASLQNALAVSYLEQVNDEMHERSGTVLNKYHDYRPVSIYPSVNGSALLLPSVSCATCWRGWS